LESGSTRWFESSAEADGDRLTAADLDCAVPWAVLGGIPADLLSEVEAFTGRYPYICFHGAAE
jgi:hypothetical protein